MLAPDSAEKLHRTLCELSTEKVPEYCFRDFLSLLNAISKSSSGQSSRPLVAFGDETYKLELRIQQCTRNLAGRSFGRCLRIRLLSGGSRGFTTRPFGCALRRPVALDFSFNCWCLDIPSDNRGVLAFHFPIFLYPIIGGNGRVW
jgi:hypothetical protein